MYSLVGYEKNTGQKVIFHTTHTLANILFLMEYRSEQLTNYYLDIEEEKER